MAVSIYFVVVLSFILVHLSPTAYGGGSSPHWIQTHAKIKLIFFKNVSRPANAIDPEKKCTLKAGEKIPLSSEPIRLSNGHLLVNTQTLLPGCKFSAGYVQADQIASHSSAVSLKAGGDVAMKIRELTWFKRGTLPDNVLELAQEKCTLHWNETIDLFGPPLNYGTYYMIAMKRHLPGCKFSVGLVRKDHVVIEDRQAIPEPETGSGINKYERAFLDMIAYAEGTHDKYNIIYSGRRFSSYRDHPRRIICSGYCSDAAGRYQFLSTTWDMCRSVLGLPDFGPNSQDRAALYLIHRHGVLDIRYVDTLKEFSYVLYLLRYEWASLPHSPYGQPTKGVEELWNYYRARAGF